MMTVDSGPSHYAVYIPKRDEIVILKRLMFGFIVRLETEEKEFDEIDTKKFFNKHKDTVILGGWSE